MRGDGELRMRIEEALAWDPRLTPGAVQVTLDGGRVLLVGHVPAYSRRVGAERVARRVAPGWTVVNRLEVRLPAGAGRPDADLAAAVGHALRTRCAVPADRVRVSVRDGTVVLHGTVQGAAQREAAERAAACVPGICGIVNAIAVPRAGPPPAVRRTYPLVAAAAAGALAGAHG
jgi:osmotically-inducible protein OsmY